VPTFTFRAHIAPKEFENYYKGMGFSTIVTLTDGRTMSMPTKLFTKFITPNGIKGTFKLTTASNSSSTLKRISDA
jgi:hypothetical protein